MENESSKRVVLGTPLDAKRDPIQIASHTPGMKNVNSTRAEWRTCGGTF